MKLDSYENIILDCDGVILDSNQFKVEAFTSSIEEVFGSVADGFSNYLLDSYGRLNRTQIFKGYLELNGLQSDQSKDILNNLLEVYGNKCFTAYLSAAYLNGFEEFMGLYKNKDKYVVSASDEDELKMVFDKKGIVDHFKEVYGNRQSKKMVFEHLAGKGKLKNAVFIGDSLSDYECANAFEIPFIFMQSKSLAKLEDMIILERDSMAVVDNFGALA